MRISFSQSAGSQSFVLDISNRLFFHWSRVSVGAPGATFLLTAGDKCGRAEVFEGEVRLEIAADALASGFTCAIVVAPPNAVVYARLRRHGVSLLIGSRRDNTGAAGSLLYAHHWSAGNTVLLSTLRAALPTPPKDVDNCYIYSLPRICTALTRNSVLSEKVVNAETDSYSSRTAPEDARPSGPLVSLPPDAFQVAYWIAQHLNRGDVGH
jgi:hypothetical protein